MRWRRALAIIVSSAAIALACAGVGAAALVIADSNLEKSELEPLVSGGAELASQPLTLAGGKILYDNFQRSKETLNTTLFTESVCREFIEEDMRLRQRATVTELLSGYKDAEQFVPVQFIDDPVVVAASSEDDQAIQGTITVRATVTDNRSIPAQVSERDIPYRAIFEVDRWKICPSTGPV